MEASISLAVGLGSAFASIIAAILTYRATQNRLKEERKEIMAGAEKALAEATEQTLKNFSLALERLEKEYAVVCDENTAMKKFINALYAGIRKLIKQLEAKGIEPDWRPPPINGWRQ